MQIPNSRIPRFRIARNFENATARGRIIKLSIAPEEVTQDKLISLVCKLGRDYANEQVLVIWILNNNRGGPAIQSAGRRKRYAYGFGDAGLLILQL